VAGLDRMVVEQGTLPLAQILAPAVNLAREGVILSDALAYVAHILTPIFTDTPEMAAIYAPTGQMPEAGERLQFPALADSLERLGENGASLFYTGQVAEQILSDQRANAGLLTETDLASYRVHKTNPIAIDYRGYTILLPPPSSSGGALIAFALKLLATVEFTHLGHNSFGHLRLLTELMRLTNTARANWQNDCGLSASASPVDQAECIGRLLATVNVARYHDMLQRALSEGGLTSAPDLPSGPNSTTHISVADTNGMIVAITTSAGENAGFTIGDTGITLNNMLGEIDLHPNGFHKLLPGQRLMTMMTPVLILHRGQPMLAVGSGGSNRLRTAIAQVISNFIDFNMSLDQAVDAPRLHFEEGIVQLEGGIEPDIADKLETTGYTVNRWPQRNMFFGGAHAVAQINGSWVAAGDSRRGGSVLVV
jgi:gamma-glutamyltranspeptidase/glutathione hydrolase